MIEHSGRVVVCCLWGFWAKKSQHKQGLCSCHIYTRFHSWLKNEPLISIVCWKYPRKVKFSISRIRRICCSFPLLCVESSVVCVTIRNVMNYLINKWGWFSWKLQTSIFELKWDSCWLWVRGKRTVLWNKMDVFWIVIPKESPALIVSHCNYYKLYIVALLPADQSSSFHWLKHPENFCCRKHLTVWNTFMS